MGIELKDGYGTTEYFGYSHLNLPGKVRPGSVGRPFDDVQQRITDDGEMHVKSPSVMIGYFKDEQSTAKTLKDGWIVTGDVGEIDSDGYFILTGRRADNFKTAVGNYVAPVPIENRLRYHPGVVMACVGGRNMSAPYGLIQLNKRYSQGRREEVIESLNTLLDETNTHFAKDEKLVFLVVVNRDWTAQNDLLTGTGKLRRQNIEKLYEDKLTEWYSSNTKVIWQ